MPVGWIGFSTASPPGFPKDPLKARAYVEHVVKRAGGEFVELYYEIDRRHRANALVLNLDDPKNVKAVLEVLEADEYTKLLLPKDAKDVDDNIIPGIKPPPGSYGEEEGPEPTAETTT
jgi:hypothetical protein